MLSYAIMVFYYWFVVFIVFFNAFLVEEQVFTQVKKTSWELHFVVMTNKLKEKSS